VNRCQVCGHFAGSATYLGGPRLDLLCHKCWIWAGRHLFGWREAA
jgi:hypothetical protein